MQWRKTSSEWPRSLAKRTWFADRFSGCAHLSYFRLVGKTAALVKDMLSREDAKSSSAGVKSSSR